MTTYNSTQRICQLQRQNQRLRSLRQSNQKQIKIDFQMKYKKALKQIYDVIQANKQLKQQLEKLKISRNKHDSSISQVRKQQFYKVYDVVLKQKNQLATLNMGLQMEKQRLQGQLQNIQAQFNMLKNDKLTIAQQKQALQNGVSSGKKQVFSYRGTQYQGKSPQQFQHLQYKIKQREAEFHRTVQNYEQHHITLTKQNKKSQQRIQQLELKILNNDKTWRDRFQSKQIQIKQIKTIIRHEYQDQVNNLRKQINSLKQLNTQLMTKIQTIQMQYNQNNYQQNNYNQYQLDLMNSLKELRGQMQPMRRQMMDLQQMSSFEKEELQRQRTTLQMKVYQMESDVDRYKMVIKGQQDRIGMLSEQVKKHEDNNSQIKKLQEQNRILGGRLIVLQSKDVVLAGDLRRDSGLTQISSSHNKLQQKVVQFQSRIELLLNDKQNISNLKNISIHQLLSLKAYIIQMDNKLKLLFGENEYAVKKYKSYKQKYLMLNKQIKQNQVTQNILKSKILGYDKLVQRLQIQLQKNVSMNQIQLINMNSKNMSQQSQIQMFKKKYVSVKQKLSLQQKYHNQELETMKLDYQSKIVDLTIKNNQINDYRQSMNMYKQKYNDIMVKLSIKQNQLLEIRLEMGKNKRQQDDRVNTYDRQILNSMKQTMNKQEEIIFKLQGESRQKDDDYRRRIIMLQRQLEQYSLQISKQKLTNSTRLNANKSVEQLTLQNKKLRNQILILQNQINLIKNQNQNRGLFSNSSQQHELQFKLSSVEMEKNQLNYRFQTEVGIRKRLQNQLVDLSAKNSQLDSEIMQVNSQFNRKLQELRYQVNQKQLRIKQLEDEISRLKIQKQQQQRSTSHRNSLDMSGININKQDNTMNELKMQRLQKRVKDLQYENEQLRRKVNNNITGVSSINNVNVSYNYQIQNLKQDKQEARMKIQRLQRELSALKGEVSNLQQENYDKNRQINQVRSELSQVQLKGQDQIYEKERIIAQLKSKIQFSENNINLSNTMQYEYEQRISDKQYEISSLKNKIYSHQQTISQLNDSINRITMQLNMSSVKNVSTNNTYIEHMQISLQQKQRLLCRFRDQNNKLSNDLDEKIQQLSYKQQNMLKLQRQIQQYKQYQYQIQRLKYSLNDRENVLNKNKYQITNIEEENQRFRRENIMMKQQIQKIKYDLINKQDQISRLGLEINSIRIKVQNQFQQEFNQQIYQKEEIISRLNVQIQGLKNSYEDLQTEYNETHSRQRKLVNDLSYLRSDLSRVQDEVGELNQKLYRREQQFNMANSELSGMKFLQQQLNEKNNQLSRMKNQLTQIKINNSHYQEQIVYKDGLNVRLQNEIQYLKRQILEKNETFNMKEQKIRGLDNQLMKIHGQYQQTVFMIGEKDMNINRLNIELNRTRKQFRDLQQQIQQRQQQWSNISYQLKEAKDQVVLISDQIQGKDMKITRMFNQNGFLKMEITRVNQQLIQKNHEINRVNQMVFTQKMQFTENISLQKQVLQRQIFTLKRQIQALTHNIQDLQIQNRHITIQNQTSRVKLLQSRNKNEIYTEEQMGLVKQDLNRKYKQIMRLQLQLSQRQDYSNGLLTKCNGLQNMMIKIQEQALDDRQRLQRQIEIMINKQKRYQQKINQLVVQNQERSNNVNIVGDNRQNNEEQLKFGLHLYTEETDRLNRIINELNEQVNGLRMKLTTMTNQQDRVEQNLITMVMTFAQVQALRQRLQKKQGEINQVRKSFIKSIVNGNETNLCDTQSGKYFKGYINKSVVSLSNNQQLIPITTTVNTINSNNKISILNMNKNNNKKSQIYEDVVYVQNNNNNNDYDYNIKLNIQEQIKSESQIQQLNQLRDYKGEQKQVQSVMQSQRSYTQQNLRNNHINIVNQSIKAASVSSSKQQYNYQMMVSVPQGQVHALQQANVQGHRVSVNYQQHQVPVVNSNIYQQSLQGHGQGHGKGHGHGNGQIIRVNNYPVQTIGSVYNVHHGQLPMNLNIVHSNPQIINRQSIVLSQHQSLGQATNHSLGNQKIIMNSGHKIIAQQRIIDNQQHYLKY